MDYAEHIQATHLAVADVMGKVSRALHGWRKANIAFVDSLWSRHIATIAREALDKAGFIATIEIPDGEPAHLKWTTMDDPDMASPLGVLVMRVEVTESAMSNVIKAHMDFGPNAYVTRST